MFPIAVEKIMDRQSSIVAVVDSDCAKWNTVKLNYTIKPPKDVLTKREIFDKVLIGCPVYYSEVKEILHQYGIADEDLTWM